MTQKGQLSDRDVEALRVLMDAWREIDDTVRGYRQVVVRMIERSSYREVARLTGFSTNTLQRWKREAVR